MKHPPLHPSWENCLKSELNAAYMQELFGFLESEQKAGKLIHPDYSEIFAAFNFAPFSEVKVVILGQDPYHGPHQAHGLSFSVRPEIKIPPSLVNIFKELHADLQIPIPNHGHLEEWARQGVLMLNTVLTVESGRAGSHQKQGWEKFTDKVIEILNQQKGHLVFILWGAPAQKKKSAIDAGKHLILEAPHPSPLSVYRGFYGSRPFSQTNQYLQQHGINPIQWNISPKL